MQHRYHYVLVRGDALRDGVLHESGPNAAWLHARTLARVHGPGWTVRKVTYLNHRHAVLTGLVMTHGKDGRVDEVVNELAESATNPRPVI